MEKTILEYYNFIFLEDSKEFPGEIIAIGYSNDFPTLLARIDTNIDLFSIDLKNILEIICAELDLKENHRGKLFRGCEIRNKCGNKIVLSYPLSDDDLLKQYAKIHFKSKTIKMNIAVIDHSKDNPNSYHDIARKAFKPDGSLPSRNEELPFYIYNAFGTTQYSFTGTVQ